MAKIVITIKGGIVQSVHSNKPIDYIIVDKDLNDVDKVSDVYQEDSLFDEFFDVLDSETNKTVLSKLSNIEDKSYNVQPKITLEQAINVMINNGYIRHFWCKEDIIQQAEVMGIELTEDEINDVMSKLEDTDADIGINWDTISAAIDYVKG
jgi:hypothetical protein